MSPSDHLRSLGARESADGVYKPAKYSTDISFIIVLGFSYCKTLFRVFTWRMLTTCAPSFILDVAGVLHSILSFELLGKIMTLEL